jgi:hypothetical protein
MNLDKFKDLISTSLEDLLNVANQQGIKLRFVGGVVRDFNLYDSLSTDIDIEICFNNTNNFKKNWAQFTSALKGKFNVDQLAYNILSFSCGNFNIECSPIRVEKFNASKGHKNFEATFESSLETALSFKRRDFTINAICVQFQQGLLEVKDPFYGLDDLNNSQIKPCDEIFFSKDPVRFLRAYRFAAKLNFSLDPKLVASLQSMDLSALTIKYFIDELKKSNDYKSFIHNCLTNMNFLSWFKKNGVQNAHPQLIDEINFYGDRFKQTNVNFALLIPLCFSTEKKLFLAQFQISKADYAAITNFKDNILNVDLNLSNILLGSDFASIINDDYFLKLYETVEIFMKNEWLLEIAPKKYNGFKRMFSKYQNYSEKIDLSIYPNEHKRYVKFYSYLQSTLC